MKGTLGPKMEMGARGVLALSDLTFADGDGSTPLLTVGRLELAGLDYAWPATATVDRVHMRKSWVRMERRAGGRAPPPPPPPPRPAGRPPPPPPPGGRTPPPPPPPPPRP